MKGIKRVIDDIETNICEAKEKILKAYRFRDEDKSEADWQMIMAKTHMDFNAKGHEIVAQKIANATVAQKDSPLAPGMLAVYRERHAELMAKAAEVNAMISTYK